MTASGSVSSLQFIALDVGQMIHGAEITSANEGLFIGKVRPSTYLRKQLISQDRKGYPESADVSNIYIRCA